MSYRAALLSIISQQEALLAELGAVPKSQFGEEDERRRKSRRIPWTANKAIWALYPWLGGQKPDGARGSWD